MAFYIIILFLFMRFLRKLLLHISIIYWFITAVRNLLFNTGIFKSHGFSVPVIAIGNLSTGGTGKTPQTEYLARLLSSQYRVATLSRGYKRKSEGFILADSSSNAETLGDEPYQFYTKFPNIIVAVDANRKNGIEQLLSLDPRPEIILLDDAYQHRRVKAGFYILLTAYGDIYADDFILPAGNLRESRSGAKRAKIIIVTKCPPQLTAEKQDKIKDKLRPEIGQTVFFSTIVYDEMVYSEMQSLQLQTLLDTPKVLVAGIAKPQPFFKHFSAAVDECLAYPDHHNFTQSEITTLSKISETKIIITTEKDYMRLKGKLPADRLFYLPIRSKFINSGDQFDTLILNYIKNALDTYVSC
jgi:tetraacyldisaccharide 4'-kinase